jgi:E3 ubiquitin-protein ligase TRIP12
MYLNNSILYNKTKLEDIGLSFVIPGYNHIDLKENGSDILVDASNLEEYLNLLFDALCYDGIKESVEAFKKGFCMVFPVSSLGCFSCEELTEILSCGLNDKWDKDTLVENIVTNHGYDKNS